MHYLYMSLTCVFILCFGLSPFPALPLLHLSADTVFVFLICGYWPDQPAQCLLPVISPTLIFSHSALLSPQHVEARQLPQPQSGSDFIPLKRNVCQAFPKEETDAFSLSLAEML